MLVLVAVVAGTILALTSYAFVRSYRLHAFEQRVRRDSRLAILAAPAQLSATSFDSLVHEYERRGSFEAVAVVGDVELSSASSLRVSDVPEGVRTLPEGRIAGPENVVVHGHDYSVSGGRTASGASLYFFFDRGSVLTSLRDIRNLLAIAWLVTVAIAAAFGYTIARETLRPVREVARASAALTRQLTGRRLDYAGRDEIGLLVVAFGEMARSVQDKVDELSERARRERRFTADVAHELRTPLTSMSSLAVVLEEQFEELPPDARRPVELLVQSVGRLRQLVMELLELARADADAQPTAVVPVRVAAAVRAACGESDARCPIDVDGDPWALADRARFPRILTNVLHNARVHGGGATHVGVRRDGAWCHIDVDDDGPGIPASDMPFVFDRFHKADSSRSTSGAGLGLAIAHEHARLLGGTLSAANRERGARFTISLRAVDAPDTSLRVDVARDHTVPRAAQAPDDAGGDARLPEERPVVAAVKATGHGVAPWPERDVTSDHHEQPSAAVVHLEQPGCEDLHDVGDDRQRSGRRRLRSVGARRVALVRARSGRRDGDDDGRHF